MSIITERDDLLKSLEEANALLTKAFGNYREFNKNQKLPKLNDDEKLTPEDSEKIIKFYDDHKKALEIINEWAANVKKEIEKLETYYNACEEKLKSAQKIIEEGRKKDSEEYLTAVKKNGQALQCIPEAMKTETLCLAAVQQDGEALRYVPEALKTEALCLAAVQQCGLAALHYVPSALATEDFCKKAADLFAADALI